MRLFKGFAMSSVPNSLDAALRRVPFPIEGTESPNNCESGGGAGVGLDDLKPERKGRWLVEYYSDRELCLMITTLTTSCGKRRARFGGAGRWRFGGTRTLTIIRQSSRSE